MRKALALVAILLLAGTLEGASPPPPTDPELATGIRQVDDGEYDGAILTLDNAARRLARDPARAAELSQAYVYLGIAYLGKGHEAAAKAKFREAVDRFKDLTLSPDEYPPKVINLFEAARAESRASSSPAPAQAEPKKKGKTGLVLLGVGGAAAVGVAVAAGGGGGGSGTSPATTTPASTTVTETFTGLLTLSESGASIKVGPATRDGQWSAQASWTGGNTTLHMFVVDNTEQGMGDARFTSANSAQLDWNGRAGVQYRVDLFLQEGGAPSSNYQLQVIHPR